MSLRRVLAVLAYCWVLLLAACGDNAKPAAGDDAGPVAPTLMSIAITPSAPQIPIQMQQQLAATGKLSDGSTEDVTSTATWSSGDAEVATVDSGGNVTAVAPGTVTIEATVGAISASVTVTVTAATLVSIAVTPLDPAALALGLTQQLTATGTFSDATTMDLTTQVTWSSTTPATATVATTGLVTTVAIGSTPITATLNSVSGSTTITVDAAALVSIAVTPANPSVPIGATQQLTATGTYTDGTTQDLTATVTWMSSDPTLASIDASGIATAVALGAPTITATLGTINGTTTFTVVAAALVSIAVAPIDPSITFGADQQFTATGTFTDGTTPDLTSTVTWTSSDPTIATITAAGDATGTGSGTVTITATQGAISGTTSLSVDVPLTSIAVTPVNPTVSLLFTQQFTATGTYADGSTKVLAAEVTWASSNPLVMSVSAAGLATGLLPGDATITATVGAISGSTVATVTSAVLVSIAVTPADPSLPLGLTQAFTATGTFSDGSTQDLTTQVTWTSSDSTIATISNAGLATAVAIGGPTTITATNGAVSGTTTLTVTAAVLVSIAVTPANPEILPGGTQQLVATGTMSDTTTQVLTATATWAAVDPTVATIAATGKATGVAPGTTTITATSGTVVGSTQLTVQSLELTQIAPVDGTIGVRVNPAIVLTFNLAVDPTTITPIAAAGACAGSVQLSADGFVTCIGLAATYNTADTVATLATASALTSGTTYKVRVLGTVATTAGFALGADVTQPNGFTVGGASLVISQIYGAGGNSGAFYNQDFVELHNNTAAPVSLDGYSLQYASATGSSWTVAALPATTVPAGGYYLIGLASGANGVALPVAVDATLASINMSATAGKIALVPGTGSMSSASCPLASTLDFVGYGTTANCFEGTSFAPAPSTTAGDLRGTGGCMDTNVNSIDFALNSFMTGTAPRDSSTAGDVCM
ncbi:MAG TPA: Ig-like domain-containing protein [Kofleriaceae bacterium]|nr:Ig-like domain-containing protein [Kofleriaceae bacterium]